MANYSPECFAKSQHQGPQEVRGFYDRYWPANLPELAETRKHVFSLLPLEDLGQALDAGCGSGVCALALAEKAEQVVAVDLSYQSLAAAQKTGRQCNYDNIQWLHGDLLSLPLADASFDLVFSWGVIHHTVDPRRALAELVRVLRPGGTLILAVYLQTSLTWAHELVRRCCLRAPSFCRAGIIGGITALVKVAEWLGKTNNLRADNPRIQSQVEDWFFVPEKHFFTFAAMEELFTQHGLSFEILCPQTGRFKSSSNFIVRGKKLTTRNRDGIKH